ncbi:MAG: DMT family transporter [Candidatus Puniceispirillaceae bacterium]
MMTGISPPIRATIFMIGAMISFTLMAISGRALEAKLDTFEIMTYRSLFGIVLVLVIARMAGTHTEIRWVRLGLHIVRNLFHFAGQNLWFYAILYIPLSQLFAFEFSTPLWVAILAPFVLKEQLTASRIMAASLGFFGILLVARPDLSSVDFALIAAALCAVGFAGAALCTKLLTRTESTTSILFWLTVLQAIFGIVCAGYDGQIDVPRGTEILWVLIIGICGLMAHFCITSALQCAPATVVTPLEFLRLPLITVVGYFMYQEPLEALVFLGAGVVLLANIINLRAEYKNASS